MFNSSYLTAPEKIEEELADMQQFLETPFASDNPAACMERIEKLVVIMSRSGKLKADSEHHYSSTYNSSVMKALEQMAKSQMGISTVNKYIESFCKDYKQLITWADRTNRASVHQIDSLRTLISYAKQERQYA